MKYQDAVASLQVRDVVDSDAGMYTCRAFNKLGDVSTAACLRIKGKEARLIYKTLPDWVDHSRLAPSQWEASLQNNAVSH